MRNTIFIALDILGIGFMIERLGVRKGSIHICISGWHTGDVGILSSLIITKGEVDILGCGGLGAGVGCLCQSWGGAPVP